MYVCMYVCACNVSQNTLCWLLFAWHFTSILLVTSVMIFGSVRIDLFYHSAKVIPGAARVAPEARPAAAIVNSLVCGRTGLPLISA